jgi:hypothetical protein
MIELTPGGLEQEQALTDFQDTSPSRFLVVTRLLAGFRKETI